MLMQGFPPPPGARVTLANWQEPPFNRWSFSHMRELAYLAHFPGFGSGNAAAGQPAAGQPAAAGQDRTAPCRWHEGERGRGAGRHLHRRHRCRARRPGGARALCRRRPPAPRTCSCRSPSPWSAASSATSSSVASSLPPIWSRTTCRNSSKAATGGRACATSWTCAPESNSARTTPIWTLRCASSSRPWAGALGVGSAGAQFDVRLPDNSRRNRRARRGLRLPFLRDRLLGWVCERATNTRMADLISELVWSPIGAERDAEMTCDAAGTAIHDGGMRAPRATSPVSA